MSVSAYSIAIGVQQRRFPWRAAIESALSVADEFCLVYDSRFDDAETLQTVSERLKLIPVTIDFLEWDFVNNLLTLGRRSCSGEWCLQTEMDMVFDDKAKGTVGPSISEADDMRWDALSIHTVSPIQDLVKPKAGRRAMLTRNLPFIRHKTAHYMIGLMESDIWGGKYIRSYGFDDWSIHDDRSATVFSDGRAGFVGGAPQEMAPKTKQGIEAKVKQYTHAWHVPFYNPGRKAAQGRQTAEWQDRTYGRSATMDVEKLIESLKTPIIIDPERSRRDYAYFKSQGWVSVELDPPACLRSWLDSMSLDAV